MYILIYLYKNKYKTVTGLDSTCGRFIPQPQHYVKNAGFSFVNGELVENYTFILCNYTILPCELVNNSTFRKR